MGTVRIKPGGGGQLGLAFGLASIIIVLAGMPSGARAQLFDPAPMLRPPNDVPSVPPGPAQRISPANSTSAASAAPKGPMLQSLPPAASPGPIHAAPTLPAGQGALALTARFSHDPALINGGLHWRVFRIEENGAPRMVQEDKTAAPTFVLPPGAYV